MSWWSSGDWWSSGWNRQPRARGKSPRRRSRGKSPGGRGAGQWSGWGSGWHDMVQCQECWNEWKQETDVGFCLRCGTKVDSPFQEVPAQPQDAAPNEGDPDMEEDVMADDGVDDDEDPQEVRESAIRALVKGLPAADQDAVARRRREQLPGDHDDAKDQTAADSAQKHARAAQALVKADKLLRELRDQHASALAKLDDIQTKLDFQEASVERLKAVVDKTKADLDAGLPAGGPGGAGVHDAEL